MGKYDDIINMDRPKSNRPSMSRADRAKIFMPFAALKGPGARARPTPTPRLQLGCMPTVAGYLPTAGYYLPCKIGLLPVCTANRYKAITAHFPQKNAA